MKKMRKIISLIVSFTLITSLYGYSMSENKNSFVVMSRLNTDFQTREENNSDDKYVNITDKSNLIKELSSVVSQDTQVNNQNKVSSVSAPLAAGKMTQASLNTQQIQQEEYGTNEENAFIETAKEKISTFSIDVDTASYGIIRRNIKNKIAVDPKSVRIEEMLNYFKFDYPKPAGEAPFSVYTEISDCPWQHGHKLLLIGLQGKEVDIKDIPASNLVFLIDVSGSMSAGNKLPLVKQAFTMLTENLRSNDRISIVTYAGSDAIVLQGEPGNNKMVINDAISVLESGGSTAGAKGLETAYEIGKKYFIEGGNNRVILATDGDFNVGLSSEEEMKKLIETKRSQGIYLSVMGFGDGNVKDNKMQTLADNGNGNYSYIDSVLEAKRVLVEEMGGTLLTIAKDVKLQLTFSDSLVKSYRLIGYENRMLNTEDFVDDTKDAGEMGAGHRVTAIYEIITQSDEEIAADKVWATVDLRYKKPDENTSRLLSIKADQTSYRSTQSDIFAFSTSVVEFGLLLKNSIYKGNASYTSAYERIKNMNSIKMDPYKLELLDFLRNYSE